MKKNNLQMLAMMLLSMMGLTVSAHDIEVANADGVTIYYNYTNDGKELAVTFRGEKSISYTNEYVGNLVIPNEVTYMTKTRKVTSIGRSAFASCGSLTSVTIPISVTSIGEYAFFNCNGITSVHISDIVAWCNIAFSSTIPNPYHLYLGELEIINLVIPNGVTSIGGGAFARCSSLISVTIPNSVTSIGGAAFSGCSGLTSVIIPNSVTSIGGAAFSGCSGLTSVTIGKNVTSIGSQAFSKEFIPTVISLIENPFSIIGKGNSDSPFSDEAFLNSTLYVPAGTIEKYRSTEGWKDFVFIEEVTEGGTTPEAKKCATPTISFVDGKLTFDCETEGVSYTYEITNDDVKRGIAPEVQLAVVYKVSVYATKDGYENSDVATAEFTFGGNADTGVKGDMNGDNIVNALDIQLIIMISANSH